MSASEGHSRTGKHVKCRGRQVNTEKKASEGEGLTVYQAREKRLVGTANESERAKVTHSLSGEKGSRSQDSGSKPASEKRSRPVESRVRDSSGQQTNAGKQGTLTPY
jgi:hypothetical protein